MDIEKVQSQTFTTMNTFTILTLTLIQSTTSSHLYPLTPPPSTLQCSIETNVPSYPSTFNQTSLLSCHNATRPEKICIVGAGSSGIHLGWLLKRRGFNNTILFDRNNRTGGDVWTYSKNESGASFTRELGAAFLSPDYDEVRGLLKRFNRTEVPISVTKQMNFHSQNVTETAKNWYTNWIFNITGVQNVTIQNQHVQAALLKYNTIHESIFGTYEGRFPPLPTSSTAMQLLNQTAISFLMTNQLEILHPLMYQFFVMQGMGLLEPMSVYYMLKWCSPKSMSQGGFGNDHDTPLAMLKEGFGGLLNDMVQDVQLNVQLNTEIVQINRNENFGVQIYYTTSTLQKDPKNQRPEQEEETTMEQCDLVVLSGAIPKLLRSNILTAPTEMERDTFGTMEPMQFLVSLLDLKTTNSNNLLNSKNLKKHPIPDTMNSSSVPYKALEYWPDGYKENSGVIVRRDIGYAETNVAHTRGGLQTFSYNGADLTLSNQKTHWNSQKKWIENQEMEEFHKVFSCSRSNDIVSEFFFLVATLYSSEENYEKSIFYLNVANFLNPKFKFNLSLLAENHYVNQNYKETVKVLKNFNENDEFYYWFKIKKEAQIISKQKSEEASMNFINSKFRKIKDPSIKIIFDVANFNKNAKKYKIAIGYYDKILSKINITSDLYSEILYRRGTSYERLKDYKNSDRDLLESLKINPDDAYVLNYLAYSWLEREYKIDLSLQMLEKAYAQRNNDPYIIDSIGWAYYLVEDFVKAENFIKRAVELMPGDPIVNDHYGDILWKLDRKIQARYFWTSVLNLEKTEEDMKKNINIKLIEGLKKS